MRSNGLAMMLTALAIAGQAFCGMVVAFLLGGLGFLISGDPEVRSLPWLIGCSLGAALGVVAARAHCSPAVTTPAFSHGRSAPGQGGFLLAGERWEADDAEFFAAVPATAVVGLLWWLFTPRLGGALDHAVTVDHAVSCAVFGLAATAAAREPLRDELLSTLQNPRTLSSLPLRVVRALFKPADARPEPPPPPRSDANVRRPQPSASAMRAAAAAFYSRPLAGVVAGSSTAAAGISIDFGSGVGIDDGPHSPV